MATEYIQERYYESSKSKWIDINLSCKSCIEFWLSKLLFKNDLSRIIYSKKDITFRRRIELLDKGKTEATELTPTTLNLPFASYSQEGDWEADDRGFTQQVGQALIGQYDMTFFHRIRSIACKSKFKVILFFSRRDDVRQAQQILYWEQEPKSPTFLYSIVTWRKKPLGIPVNITIENINTNPDYAELTFLEQMRIFPIEVDLTVRSYQVLLNNIDNIVALPFKYQGMGFDDTWDDDSVIYITQETVLLWALDKFDLNSNIEDIDIRSDDVSINAKKYFENQEYTDKELKNLLGELPSETTASIIKGYFIDDTAIDLNMYRYNPDKSTPTSAYIQFKIKPADYKYFDHIEFHVPAHGVIKETNCKAQGVLIDGLWPNSVYPIKIMTFSINGDVTTFNLTFTTKQDPENEAPLPNKINAKLPGLIGMKI